VPTGSDLGGRLDAGLRGLSPGYFAAAMATGIISVGLGYDGRRLLSRCLLVITVVVFVALVVLNGWRLLAHRSEMVVDLTSPSTGFGFYTFVAAADVLAARIAADRTTLALWLLGIATLAWLLRGYAVPWTTRLRSEERPLVRAANGTWFLWAVGAQSVSVAAAVLAGLRPGAALPALAVGAWFLGVVLYLMTGVMVTWRALAYEIAPDDLTPPSWIAMGAAAITALAGAEIGLLPRSALLDAAGDIVHGGALMAWVLATWLIPALFAAGWWRHVTHRVPLAYESHLWSIVFPLGMYAVASSRLGVADGFSLLGDIGRVWIWIALVAWVLTSAGWLHHVVRRMLLPDG
jgi:tellurite resistance protein TehA-like permease